MIIKIDSDTDKRRLRWVWMPGTSGRPVTATPAPPPTGDLTVHGTDVTVQGDSITVQGA